MLMRDLLDKVLRICIDKPKVKPSFTATFKENELETMTQADIYAFIFDKLVPDYAKFIPVAINKIPFVQDTKDILRQDNADMIHPTGYRVNININNNYLKYSEEPSKYNNIHSESNVSSPPVQDSPSSKDSVAAAQLLTETEDTKT